MREIKQVLETHTFKIRDNEYDDNWRLDITRERFKFNGKTEEGWYAYLYRKNSFHKMFIIGQSIKKALKKSGTGKNGSFTLDDFKKDLESMLYWDGKNYHTDFFEKWYYEETVLSRADSIFYDEIIKGEG